MRSVAGNGLGTTVGPLTGPWGITMVILGVILGGDPYGGICDSYDGYDPEI